MTAPKSPLVGPVADSAPHADAALSPLTAPAAGSAPLGSECPWKPCGYGLCCEFGPADCVARFAGVEL
jgi:hypothetical protein